jgi:hypothetical protein
VTIQLKKRTSIPEANKSTLEKIRLNLYSYERKKQDIIEELQKYEDILKNINTSTENFDEGNYLTFINYINTLFSLDDEEEQRDSILNITSNENSVMIFITLS